MNNKIKITCLDLHRTEKRIIELITFLLEGKKETIEDVISIDISRRTVKFKVVILVKVTTAKTRFEFTEVSSAPDKWKCTFGNVDNKNLPFMEPLNHEKCAALNKFFNY